MRSGTMHPPADGAQPGGALLTFRGVWKLYGAAAALRGVTLSAPSGRVLALLGPNGAGKSTVLRVAAGVARPTRGTVEVAGMPPVCDAARRLIGFAGHRTFLYPALTAEENLRFYAGLYGIAPADVEASLERFQLTRVRSRRAGELSRGLAQRLSLARALLHHPLLLLLDEPFTGLDAAAAGALADSLGGLRGEGRTVVLATHEWETAREAADEAVVLVDGRIVLRTGAGALSRSDLPALYARPVRA